MGGNYILDRRLVSSPQPSIAVRWTNVTARAALSSVLNDYKLTLVTNPATTVARIAPAILGVKPVPASQVGTNAGAVIPLMVMDDVPLSEAISKLATAAQLQLTLDPLWPESANKGRVAVSFRWQKITARQALVALLDNHELILIEGSAGSPARVVARTHAATGAAGAVDPARKQP